MLRKLFSKRVPIFGKSVSLVFLILAVIATTAFAAWLITGTVYTYVTPASGPAGSWTGSATCEILSDLGFSDTTCNAWQNGTDNGPTVAVDNARPGVIFTVVGTFQNDNANELCLRPIDLSSLPVYLESANFSASVDPIPPAGTSTITFQAEVSNLLVQSGAEELYQIDAQWAESPTDGICP